MNRIDISKARKATLQNIFAELIRELLDEKVDRERSGWKADLMYEFEMSANDFKKLEEGRFGIDGYRKRIQRMLKKNHLSAYEREDEGILLMPGNPRLTTVLNTWGVEDKDETYYYLYHYTATQRPDRDEGYSPEEKIRQALLVINYKQEESCLFFFASPKKREEELTRSSEKISKVELLEDLESYTDEWVVARYHGRIQITGSQFYLFFGHRVAFNTKTGQQEPSRHQGLVVFRTPSNRKKLQWEEVGNFAAIGPSSGICVIQECQQNEIFTRIAIPEISRKISHFLVGSSYSYANHSDFYRLSEHETLLKAINPFVGNYEGVSLVSRSGKEAISVAAFIIEADGRIRFKTVYNPDMSGYIFHVKNPVKGNSSKKTEEKSLILSCCIDYSNKHDHHRMFMVITFESSGSSNFQAQNNIAVGTYSGLFQEDDYPQSGRVLLRKVKHLDDVHVRNIPFNNQELQEELNIESSQLLAYFSGFRDDIADRPHAINSAMMDRAMYPQVHYLGKNRSKIYNGDYLLYYPSKSGDRVYQKYLKIGSDPNEVIWHDADDGSASEKYLGSIAVVKKNLSIRFNEKVTSIFDRNKPEREFMDRMLVFMIGTVPEKPEIGIGLPGKIYRQDRDHEPVMSNAVIVLIDAPLHKKSIPRHMAVLTKSDIGEDFPSADLVKDLFTKESGESLVE